MVRESVTVMAQGALAGQVTPPPLQPAKLEPVAGLAASVSWVPLARSASQVPLGVPVLFALVQVSPPAEPVTVPRPAPAKAMDTVAPGPTLSPSPQPVAAAARP